MSAFICTTQHIAYLVTAMKQWARVPMATTALGQILVNENYRAVNYRYNETQTPPQYRHTPPRLPLTGVQVLKAIACLQYQLAEPPDYETTEAWALLSKLQNAAMDNLPGWDEAKWEITA